MVDWLPQQPIAFKMALSVKEAFIKTSRSARWLSYCQVCFDWADVWRTSDAFGWRGNLVNMTSQWLPVKKGNKQISHFVSVLLWFVFTAMLILKRANTFASNESTARLTICHDPCFLVCLLLFVERDEWQEEEITRRYYFYSSDETLRCSALLNANSFCQAVDWY